jgi:DMSO/TMAO reductase YedYZ molybdopterin-dependent catalytic subunit
LAFDWLTRRQARESKKAAYKDRIPPGQELTEKWPVLHYGGVPKFDPAIWDFSISGLVAHPMTWSYADYIHCVTGWSKFDNEWEGVGVKALLEMVQPLPEARFVVVEAEEGYTTNLPLSYLLEDDALLAFRHDGENLSPDHGWPLRLVVPKLYFWKSAKWVRGLKLLDHDERGFWERYGYHNHGDPWKEERYSWQEG